jgi:hypothetical protein
MATLVKLQHILPDRYSAVKFQIVFHCFVDDLKLTKNEISALSIFYIDGINQNAIDKIITEKYFESEQSIKNLMSKLTKMGVFEKTDIGLIPTSKIDVDVSDKILMDIKLMHK